MEGSRARSEEQSKTNGSRARQQQKWECILGSFFVFGGFALRVFHGTCHVFGGDIGPHWMDGRKLLARPLPEGHSVDLRDVSRNHHTLQRVIKTCFVSFDFFKKKKSSCYILLFLWKTNKFGRVRTVYQKEKRRYILLHLSQGTDVQRIEFRFFVFKKLSIANSSTPSDGRQEAWIWEFATAFFLFHKTQTKKRSDFKSLFKTFYLL